MKYKYEELTVEAERGRTYSHDTFAIYGHSLVPAWSASYQGDGTTMRCWLQGGFATREEAAAHAYHLVSHERLAPSVQDILGTTCTALY